ncbi:YafY family transcriptional regulator [Yersinia massiliensis]|jgi:predicted DNA-binding transcriptional regulator YafY|uniref:HTH domain n=2 Tax=Yersinia TaxID=629 RepID=A0AAI8ZT53_YERFR|nr:MULTISPECIES: YafY family protein [Yersinia]HEC1648276.1 YafY family transcriptional regulator [Yersinia enterocolitica]MDA5550014.1 YafY family protein [Yersinia massiliensis]MDN0129155.1 YafY family protein [Yersinia massiliensis]NIL27838.1 YafY family transcriptional regulator [Yersinia massiliensis]OWF70995.1 transcriptional regulator [Yersinia frederiksenii]
MSRVQRLLDLMQILRSHRFPVTGAHLASELGISLRTLYRDIGILQKQGASIDGEPGLGYVLRPGFMLPPLMFSEDEIEALVLGSRWVTDRGDVKLSAAARSALTKIAAVLPNDLCNVLDATALLVGPGASVTAGDEEILQIRRAIRAERKLEVSYCNLNSVESTRTIWPFALGYFDHVRVLVAWCELRQEFRHFRTDRISSLKITEQRYPRRRQVLLKEWREIEGISPQ